MNLQLKSFQRLFIFTILFLGIFCLAKSSLAATYYVDIGGSNNGSCGSAGSPCASLSYTCNSRAVNSGDLIHINAGTYTDTGQCLLNPGVNIEGAGEATTIINSNFSGGLDRCWGVYLCMFTAMSSQPNEDENFAGTAIVAQNSVIHDFTVNGNNANPWCAIRAAGRDHKELYNLTIQNTGNRGISFEGYYTWNNKDTKGPKNYAQNILVHDSIFTNVVKATDSGAIQIEGIGIGSKFYNNTISQASAPGYLAVGMHLGERGWYKGIEIYNNTITMPGRIPIISR